MMRFSKRSEGRVLFTAVKCIVIALYNVTSVTLSRFIKSINAIDVTRCWEYLGDISGISWGFFRIVCKIAVKLDSPDDPH